MAAKATTRTAAAGKGNSKGKTAGTAAAMSTAKGIWKWTAENDRTLFLMALGRNSFGQEDYKKFAAALSPDVNANAVRQRLGKFRSDQKALFKDLGWRVPSYGSSKTSKGPSGSQERKVGDEDDEDNENDEDNSEAGTPRVKKQRTKVAVKEEPDELDIV